MGWWMCSKLYPGHGPWSYIPPYERPGWWFRSWWRWPYHYPPWLSKEDEIRYLEEIKKYLTETVIKEIDKRLEELRKGS